MKIGMYVATLTLVSAFAFSPAAFATNDNNHNQPCRQNCGPSNSGGNGASVDIDADINNNSGAWAQGGAGGSANNANTNNAQNNNTVIAGGGTAINANSNNANNSSNATGGAGGNGGAGGAGGAANNSNVNSADNSSNATGGSSSADNNGNNNSSSSNSQSQSQSANNESDNSNSNNSSQSVNTYNERNPVSTAYAAPLAVGEDTCMGSSSMGAQAVSFGLSIGTTWQDANCQRLKNSRQLVALGYQRAATALMCVDDDVRHAMAEVGTPCPAGGAVVVAAVMPSAPPAPSALQDAVVQENAVTAVTPAPRHGPRRRARSPAVDIEK